MAGYAVREAAVGVDATGYAVGEGRGAIDLARVVPFHDRAVAGGLPARRVGGGGARLGAAAGGDAKEECEGRGSEI